MPSESREYREHGVISERMQQVLDIRAERVSGLVGEQQDARRYWNERKMVLGISHEMPLAQQLGRVREAREQAIVRAPERHNTRELGEQARILDRHVQGLERHHLRVRSELSAERFDQQIGKERSPAGQALAEQVLARGREYGLPQDRAAERVLETTQRGRYVAAKVARTLARGLAHSQERDEMQHGVHWQEHDHGWEALAPHTSLQCYFKYA